MFNFGKTKLAVGSKLIAVLHKEFHKAQRNPKYITVNERTTDPLKLKGLFQFPKKSYIPHVYGHESTHTGHP
jgi:hypothetical protein